MEQERKNFTYGNPEEGVPGCVANGIDAQWRTIFTAP